MGENSYPNGVSGVYVDTTVDRAKPKVSSYSNIPKYKNINNVNHRNKLVQRYADRSMANINASNFVRANSQQQYGNTRQIVQKQPLWLLKKPLHVSHRNQAGNININNRVYSQNWGYLADQSPYALFPAFSGGSFVFDD